ncbi:MAG TPA: hypothetical protein VKD90_03935 [Gemmataceae bacterium]|nr:hypothetical protein [Gemmataceae bacterium]
MPNMKHWCFTWMPNRLAGPGADKAALLSATQWTRGDIITISFLDGDDRVQDMVRRHAVEWTAPGMADLTLDFRDGPNTMIRISFQYQGSWSVLGTTCRQITDRSQPTMNYGWLTPDSSEDEARRVVLHEFGHALGLIHEHQNPEGGIQWNRQAVIDDLSGPPNKWTEEQIEFNMFKKFDPAEVRATPVDRESIMMYPIPKRWTTDGFTADLNSNLSVDDRRLIKAAYG